MQRDISLSQYWYTPTIFIKLARPINSGVFVVVNSGVLVLIISDELVLINSGVRCCKFWCARSYHMVYYVITLVLNTRPNAFINSR